MPNLLMELDSSGIKSTSEIATPLQSASALEELNQKRNLAAGMRSPLTEGEGSRGQGEPGPSQALFTCPANSLSVGRSQSSPAAAAPGKGFSSSSSNSSWS